MECSNNCVFNLDIFSEILKRTPCRDLVPFVRASRIFPSLISKILKERIKELVAYIELNQNAFSILGKPLTLKLQAFQNEINLIEQISIKHLKPFFNLAFTLCDYQTNVIEKKERFQNIPFLLGEMLQMEVNNKGPIEELAKLDLYYKEIDREGAEQTHRRIKQIGLAILRQPENPAKCYPSVTWVLGNAIITHLVKIDQFDPAWGLVEYLKTLITAYETEHVTEDYELPVPELNLFRNLANLSGQKAS
jgi:hypothetical protein